MKKENGSIKKFKMEKDMIERFEKIERRLDKIEEKLIDKSLTQQISKEIFFKQKPDINDFCKNLQINEIALRNKIDFQKEMPRLMELPREKTRTKTQYKSLMILGLLYKKIYDGRIDNNKIIELFQFGRIPIERMDKLYGSPMFRKFFTKSNNEIIFSWAGEKEAEKLLKELVEYGKPS